MVDDLYLVVYVEEGESQLDLGEDLDDVGVDDVETAPGHRGCWLLEDDSGGEFVDQRVGLLIEE